jgi:hypothetical protein
MPSIAERWISGTEYRAKMGPLVILPTAPSSGTCTVEGMQENSRERRERASSREITDK